MQVKEPYGNLDMVTFRLSSFNWKCTKYIIAYNAHEGVCWYIKIDRKYIDMTSCKQVH